MDKPIRVGDLVMIVKSQPCCNLAGSVGLIFTVLKIGKERTYCSACSKISFDIMVYGEDDIPCFLSRVKKIPPLSETDDVEIKEVIEA